MSSKLQKQDIRFINEFLNDSCMDISDIYKLEGYIVGWLCCNNWIDVDEFVESEIDLVNLKAGSVEKFKNFYLSFLKKIDSSLENSGNGNYSPLFIENDAQATKFARGFLYSYFLGDLSNTKFAELNYTAINVVADYIDYDLMDIDPSYSTFVVEILKDKISSLFISINKLASLRSKRVSNILYLSDTFRLNNISETFH